MSAFELKHAAPRGPTLARARPCRLRTACLTGLALLAACAPLTATFAFGFEAVIARAQKLAATEYRSPAELPDVVRKIGYDQHRGIRYKAENNLWRDDASGFEVSPVMPGNVYTRTVSLNEVDGATVRRVPFRKENFSFDDAAFAEQLPDDLGYSGFELSYPMHQAATPEKFFVFAGASYFRGIGKGGQFGLSIRGAAIDTGLASGEEFPDFVEFWLVKPAARATSLTVYALLDSRRLTGAYEFTITPGEPTQVMVRSTLFTRERIGMLGVAPLTSMYFYGENSPSPLGAWRPEIHDSDGLMLASTSGEWLWHPLVNPSVITLKSFPGREVRTFGLVQRDTQFASYEDPGTNYHKRPSATVELGAGLRDGRIVLVQLPTGNEFADNIVAFWAPNDAVPAGARLDVQYRLNLGDPAIAEPPLAHVVQTFVGRDVNAVSAVADRQRFIVDFAGPRLDEFPAGAAITANISGAADVTILEHQLERIDASRVWRLSILTRTPADRLLGLRAGLTFNGAPVSELWSYELEAGNAQR